MQSAVVTLFFLVCMADGLPASAQSLKLPTLVYAGAVTADWSSTYRTLSLGGTERNIALRFLHDDPVKTVVVGAAMDAIGAWVWNRYIGKTHPKLATIGLYAAAGFRTWCAVRNTRAQNAVTA